MSRASDFVREMNDVLFEHYQFSFTPVTKADVLHAKMRMTNNAAGTDKIPIKQNVLHLRSDSVQFVYRKLILHYVMSIQELVSFVIQLVVLAHLNREFCFVNIIFQMCS